MSAWPDVADWLNTTTTALWPNVTVFYGPAVTGDDPADYFTVGHVTDDNGGDWQQVGNPGGHIDEIGSVRSLLVCQSGDEEALSALVRRCDGYATQLDTALRGDQTLAGVLSLNGTAYLSTTVQSIQNRQGVAHALLLTVSYSTISWPQP